MSTFIDLAKKRRSVRTFDGQMPDQKLIDELKDYASEITNPYGIKVRFEFLDAEANKLSSPVLAGEKMYITASVKKQENAEEAYGYSFEMLQMKALELGLGTAWIGGTLPREKFEAAIKLSEDEIMPCVSPLGRPAQKMSIKETLMRKGVKAESRMKMEELFFVRDFAMPLDRTYAVGHGLMDDLEAVRIAPSAVNKQPWRILIEDNKAHFYEKKDKGFATQDYDVQKVDLGIAMYHFEAQLISEGRKPILSTREPNLIVPDQMEYIATYTF